ncbi:8-oxo-dGTP pyrophosphatase MutT, NUDIX family [Poseidonocella pacifica]|uniref:8-oxo-dGTP pyrophosphatase MutT, NUDIX family n=1 Tax=Poseidonocella pacifica TaxID=871651 RepID=A0A1I0WGC9_9RHOB|nr:NUDIX hydrolase [Poseidonocella pacifica]SFA87802.1 8-oxo-dGTP pyrophosphatase MutT, NUDIX family [Poseidonocella pacifica]
MSLRKGRKRDVRVQFAALPYRVEHGQLEFLLITSRETKRWIVPKGWPMNGMTPSESALIEAYEEAGVNGRTHETCVGVFPYVKRMKRKKDDLNVLVMIYPIAVSRLAKDWPEKNERRRKWMSRSKAAASADDHGLGEIIKAFDPDLLK